MQNQKTLQQMIREYEMNMPPEILDLVKSFDWKKEVRMIVNQNQLLLDVGADLEESVYLLILGIVDIEDIFNRLIETHELPQDKVQKILTEVEKQIFEPMHQKLIALDEKDTPKPTAQPQAVKNSLNPILSTPKEPKDMSREDILSEIEKDPEPMIKKEIPKIDFDISENQTQSFEEEKPFKDDGIIEPFSLNPDASFSTQVTPQPIDEPVESALTKPTVAQIPVPPPPPLKKEYAADPYREPIE